MSTDGPVDAERGLVVRRVAGIRMPERQLSAWLFQHGDALVPFETDERWLDEDGRVVVELTLDPFGFSGEVFNNVGVPTYRFASKQEEREWALLAIEGVVVDTDDRFRGTSHWTRVAALGRTWTLSDFGYDKEDFRDS